MLLVELCEFENAGQNEVPGMMLVVRGGWIGVHFHRPNAQRATQCQAGNEGLGKDGAT